MQELIIKNVKEAEYKDVNLNKMFDPQSSHGKEFEFKNSVISSPYATQGKLFVTFYNLMPGKTNYPYHHHAGMEEVYYIISGTGTLKTPDGDKSVTAGDVIVLPTNANGAHQLTNTSDDVLVYLDIDSSVPAAEVVFFPDTNKVRVMNVGFHKSFKIESEVNYIDGE